LEHVLSRRELKADLQRIEAILNYPAPWSEKRLRKFLGTCNYHHRFIVNYAWYVEPLLGLLRKGTKWRRTEEMQTAFETLQDKFATQFTSYNQMKLIRILIVLTLIPRYSEKFCDKGMNNKIWIFYQQLPEFWIQRNKVTPLASRIYWPLFTL
jgi:hypothetical protein